MVKIVSDATKSAQKMAQTIAKQMAQEPLEILKDAREQATGEQLNTTSNSISRNITNGQNKTVDNQDKVQDQIKSGRRMEALQREIEDIRRMKLFRELQTRITQGEDIALTDFAELTMEQKQVLSAQLEAVKNQKRLALQNNGVSMPAIHSKPSRRFGAGQKSQAEKEQTRVEKPVPPSG